MDNGVRRKVGQWLNQPEHKDVNWLLGDLLRARMNGPCWLDNPVLQVIAMDWGVPLSRIVSVARKYIVENEALHAKLNGELNPKAVGFDTRIEDFVAEIVAVYKLGSLVGFKNFEFLVSGDKGMPDFRAVKEETPYYIEVKNLREPNSVSVVALRRWHRRTIEDPDRFRFTVELDFHSQIEPDLSDEQIKALEAVIDSLPDKRRPCDFTAELPRGLDLQLTISDGSPVMISYGAGGIMDPLIDMRTRTFVIKVLDHASKGLRQLYGSHLDPEARRLLVLRWKVPADSWFVADDIQAAIQDSLEKFLAPYFGSLEIHIIKSTDNIEA